MIKGICTLLSFSIFAQAAFANNFQRAVTTPWGERTQRKVLISEFVQSDSQHERISFKQCDEVRDSSADSKTQILNCIAIGNPEGYSDEQLKKTIERLKADALTEGYGDLLWGAGSVVAGFVAGAIIGQLYVNARRNLDWKKILDVTLGTGAAVGVAAGIAAFYLIGGSDFDIPREALEKARFRTTDLREIPNEEYSLLMFELSKILIGTK